MKGRTLNLFQTIKNDYANATNLLVFLKGQLVQNEQAQFLGTQIAFKLRMLVERHLIDINEEMYSLSDELAKAYLTSTGDAAVHAAVSSALVVSGKEFDKRKTSLLKRI